MFLSRLRQGLRKSKERFTGAEFAGLIAWFGVAVLHEPEIVPGFRGAPLAWVDLVNLVLLIYIGYFALSFG